jgi:hypothetical protein
MSNYPYVPESTTVIEYPKSKRRIVFNHKGQVVSDTKEKEEDNKK